MIGFVVRQMDLEDVKPLVDGLWQSELGGKHVDGSASFGFDVAAYGNGTLPMP